MQKATKSMGTAQHTLKVCSPDANGEHRRTESIIIVPVLAASSLPPPSAIIAPKTYPAAKLKASSTD